jgi:sugar O-acyltransferase (sialic acid O-acetyltransferase NeuD family)
MDKEVKRPDDFVEFRRECIFQGIHQRIEEQSAMYPTNVALKTRTAAYRYAEMNGIANAIASEILSRMGAELAQAAIVQSKSPELVISILAALKAHKAYVPLDPKFPKERLNDMMQESEAAIVLTDDQNLPLADELASKRAQLINISSMLSDHQAPNPCIQCEPVDRAYILFTSGTTGRPKGIEYLHRNLLHTTMCLTNRLFFAPSDRVTWLHSASFSASVVDLYCGLTNGATIYPWDAKVQGFVGLADWLTQERVTTLQWIPSALRQFLRTVPEEYVFPYIRMVIMASEPLTAREVDLFKKHFPVGSYLVNQVGTSESYNYGLYIMTHDTNLSGPTAPAGYAVSEDRQVVILDRQHREVQNGDIGEIGIRSDFMAAGYWRNEALTREQFVKSRSEDTPTYLTGDLGRFEQDGCLVHLGRRDSQVKIRGHRIELAEIDNAMMCSPGVADAATAVVTDGRGEQHLVAYLIPNEAAKVDQERVESHLRARVADYMIPKKYVVLEQFPVLPTGKIDKKSLPNPFGGVGLADLRPKANRTERVRVIVDMFSELLQIQGLNLATNFLSAGGDSLLVAVLLSQIHRKFGVEIGVDEFMDSPTPLHLADLVESTARAQHRAVSVESVTPRLCTPCARTSDLGQTPDYTQRNLVIICAGGLGREVFAWATQAIGIDSPWRIKGFLDAKSSALDGFSYECKILGDPADYRVMEDDVFIGAIGNPADKIKCYSPILAQGGRFVNVIHPLANIGNNVKLGNGIVVAPFASLTVDVTVGDHVSIGAFTNIGHDTVIGSWSQISSHCGVNGASSLGEGVFLGSHACIIPKVCVGSWAYVGAASVVVRNVEPNVKVFGNPASPIGKVAVGGLAERRLRRSVPRLGVSL